MRMATERMLWAGLVAGLIVVAGACSRSAPTGRAKRAPPGGVLLRGAGATFPAPLYEKWFAAYEQAHPAVAIAYEPVGSGVGVKRFIGKSNELPPEDLVDFAASDAAMTDAEIAEVARGVQLVPITAGAVVLAYHLPGLEGDLKLTRDAYSGIFLGEITRWNDSRIVKTNPGLMSAGLTIAVVVRHDASGTTYALTNHLSAISSAWRDRFGAAQLVDWPGTVVHADGNAGVAGHIKVSLGAIGYVHYGFAQRLGLKMALLQNKAGQFVTPSAESSTAALAAAKLPKNLRLFFPDPDGSDCYPIVTLSWALLYRVYPDAKMAAALQDLFRWCLGEGQALSAELGYVRLSSNVIAAATAAVESVRSP
jgi:phosphate transport system substrate-binding protein